MKNLDIVILAAGKGSRMKTKKPKLLNQINGKSLIEHTIFKAKKIKNSKVNIIINKDLEYLKEKFNKITFIKQDKANGTGHAVKTYIKKKNKFNDTLIMMGDAPFIALKDLNRVINYLKKNAIVVLGSKIKKNFGNGLIILKNDSIKEIKEFKVIEKKSNNKYYNTGVFGIQKKYLKLVKLIKKNEKLGEFLITDLLKIAFKNNVKSKLVITERNNTSFGINTIHELKKISKFIIRS